MKQTANKYAVPEVNSLLVIGTKVYEHTICVLRITINTVVLRIEKNVVASIKQFSIL
jgi:hypothetical protein